MAYCDTNIITAFINKPRLERTLGRYGSSKFINSIRQENSFSENKAKQIKSCKISRDALVSDIGKHEPSLGAVLTFSGLKNIEIVNVNGLKEGRKIYNKACEKIPSESRFAKSFCKDKKLKLNSELSNNDLNDIKHFGSAIVLNEEEFITVNNKDFKPLKNYTKIRIK